MSEFIFRSRVWVYQGLGGWFFVNVPKAHTLKIKKLYSGLERGFGSFPVMVCVGESKWKTSIFPDSKTGTYLLPIKKQVRVKEGIVDNQMLFVKVKMLIG